MTKKEIINFLHNYYQVKKTKIKTIKDMIKIADQFGYVIVKNKPDNYTMYEKGVIVHFNKPLKINRELPKLAASQMYNGVPLSLIVEQSCFLSFNVELWCYLMNKNDGEFIDLNEIKNLKISWCENKEKIVRNFDNLVYLGYLREKENCIECYAYPLQDKIIPPNTYFDYEFRLAPAIFE